MKKNLIGAFLFLLQPLSSFANTEILSMKDAFRNPYVLRIQLSPDAKHILAVLNGDKHKTLTLVNIEKGSAINLYTLEKGETADVDWIDNDTIFLDFQSNDSAGSVKGFVEIPSASRQKPEFRAIRGDGYLVNPLSNNDNQLLFARKRGEGYDLHRISPDDLVAGKFDGELALKKKLSGKVRYFYDERNNQFMAYSFENGRLQCLALDKNSNSWIRIWESSSPADTFIPVSFIDQNTLLVLSNIETERTALRTYRVDQRKFVETLYEHPRYDLISAGVDANSRQPNFVMYREHGQIATHYFSPHEARVERALKDAFSNKEIQVVSETSDGEKKLLYVSTSNDPGQYFYFDLKTLKARLIYPRFDHLDKYQFASTEKYEVENNGQKIEAILTPPIGASNDVLLVMPHGGPVGVRDSDDFNLMNQYFSTRGYAVLNINFRGSSGFGKKFTLAGRGEFGKAIESDINAAVDYVLKKRPFTKLCAMGLSYGGYSSAMLAIQNPNRYQCVVSLFGVYDLPLLFSASNLAALPEHQKGIRYIVGENSPTLKTISPVYLAESLKVPVLLVAGKLDQIATFEHSNRFKQQLKRFNKSVETLFFDDVGHGHREWLSEQVQYAYIDKFLRETLKLDPLPNKKIQAEEALLLADAFYFDDNVANDLVMAFRYYRKAAEMDDPTGMYRTGLMYENGTGVEKNFSAAIDWYKKAAAKDSDEANLHLSRLLLNPRLGVLNAEQSFVYLKRADELKSTAASLEMAKHYALGIGVAKNWSKAEEILLKPLNNIKEDQKLRKKILAEIAWDASLNESDNFKLKSILRALYPSASLTAKLTDESHGLYQSQKYSIGSTQYVGPYLRQEQTTTIPIKKEIGFGAMLEFSQISSDSKTVLLKYIWRRPASVNVDYRIFENGMFVDEFKTKKDIPFIYQLDLPSEMLAGDWQLEVRTLDNELMYLKNFKTVQGALTSDEVNERK